MRGRATSRSRAGQLVVIDWGAELDGYCSDCTRTVATGEPSTPRRHEIYELVLDAQLAGLEEVRPGAGGRDVDSVAARRDRPPPATASTSATASATASGSRSTRRRGSRSASDSVLAPGNVVTVEPGVYLPGRFGVRIEDLVVVTDDGREILTSISKELTVVD